MKKIITLCLSLCMTAALAAPAYALEYSIDAPNDYDFGKDTSIEVIHTADGGAMRNEDVSSEFDVKAQKKIVGYRNKLVISHTRNK